jgi:hypothetical protein
MPWPLPSCSPGRAPRGPRQQVALHPQSRQALAGRATGSAAGPASATASLATAAHAARAVCRKGTDADPPVRGKGTTARCAGRGAAGLRAPSWRAVTGTSVLIARAEPAGGNRYCSTSRSRRVPQRPSASPTDSPEPADRYGPVPLRATAGRHPRPRLQSRRPVRSDRPQCAAPLPFVAHTRCGRPRLRRRLRRDLLLLLQPPRRPTAVGAVRVGTQRCEGYGGTP